MEELEFRYKNLHEEGFTYQIFSNGVRVPHNIYYGPVNRHTRKKSYHHALSPNVEFHDLESAKRDFTKSYTLQLILQGDQDV